VAAAIRGFNAMPRKPDLLIVARGGGSLEDLWPFNEEIVVRAAFESDIPLISAIGHETDTTLIDFASDWRAPTPTAAAERAVPVRADLLAELASLNARQRRTLGRIIADVKTRLHSASRALPKADDLLAAARQRLDTASGRLPKALKANVQDHAVRLAKNTGRLSVKQLSQRIPDLRRRLADHHKRIENALAQNIQRRKDRLGAETKLFGSLNYRAVLSRGYAVVRDQNQDPLRGVIGLGQNQLLDIEMTDGRITVATASK
jgi:exodeoxyribonuclease VII large subunit